MLNPDEIAPKVAFWLITSVGDNDKAMRAIETEIAHYRTLVEEREQVRDAMLNGEIQRLQDSMKVEDVVELAKTAKPDAKLPMTVETNAPKRGRGRPPKNATVAPTVPVVPVKSIEDEQVDGE
jgi:hypothetical protein